MKLKNTLKFKDIIDINILEKSQIKLSELIGFPLFTVDLDGNIVSRAYDNRYFCNKLCGNTNPKVCFSVARWIDSHEYKEASFIFNCNDEVSSFAVPIRGKYEVMAFILGGQFKIGSTEDDDSLIPTLTQEQVDNSIASTEILADYFSQICINHINTLELKAETEKKLEYQKKAEKAELKILESQLNPHFVFNTLNSIARMAFFEDAEKTEERIYSLSDFLRYNLKQMEDFPTLGTEIRNIEKYLFIQKIRYEDRIDYKIDIDKDIMDYRIPSMIIQPLVENAIIHGLEPKIEGGTISIVGKKEASNIVIQIIDSGIGISDEVKNHVLEKPSSENLGLGIQNSQSRIRAYFGDDYGIEIDNEGKTIMKVTIPCFKDMEPIL